MIKLSRKMEYALIALKHLSAKKQNVDNCNQSDISALTTAKELTLMYAIPFDVISRVLQVLAQKNVVKSIQGVHGGYYLSISLKNLSLKDLIEFIEGPVFLVKCLSEDEGCSLKESCNITSPLSVLNEKVKEFYAGLSLDELFIGQKNPVRPYELIHEEVLL